MKRTILLADDSVTIQKVVELTFMDEDVKVVSVGNGSDAVAKLEDLRPDIVLADVHMPGADGYEVCETVRRILPGVPVLLLVGTFEIFDPERAAASGATSHLKKPFDSQELLRRVREMLEGAAASPAAVSASAPVAPAWAPSPAAVGAAESSPAGDWSFEPVLDAEPAAEPASPPSEPSELFGVPPRGGDEAERFNAFATSRFTRESLAVSAPPEVEASVLEAEFEPEAEAESYAILPVTPAVAAPETRETAEPAGSGAPVALSDADVERIARRVAELVAERAVRDVAWEVVPDLAEVLLKARIRELEASVE